MGGRRNLIRREEEQIHAKEGRVLKSGFFSRYKIARWVVVGPTTIPVLVGVFHEFLDKPRWS